METACFWFWLGFAPMDAVDSDTIYCSFLVHSFLMWSSFAPSMPCSCHPAFWLQPTLGTEAVKAFKLPRMLLCIKKPWLFLWTLYLSQKCFVHCTFVLNYTLVWITLKCQQSPEMPTPISLNTMQHFFSFCIYQKVNPVAANILMTSAQTDVVR